MNPPAPTAGPDAGLLLRDARDDDLPAICSIYREHVLHGSATFEIEPPDVGEIARRRADVLAKGLPFLVAELPAAADGGAAVVGYAYANSFRPRVAYRYTVEDSIYLAPQAQRRGIGKRLLAELIARCEALDLRQMVAVIGDSANAGSIALHRALGFGHLSIQPAVGLKFGRWLDTVTMQRALGAGAASLPASAADFGLTATQRGHEAVR
jgi:phosphinothricin acetyltransferase